MDTRIRHKVGLELCDIDVKSSVEAERGSQRRNALSDQPVQIGIGWALNIQVAAANVVDGLVVKGGIDVHVLEKGVHRENRVVRLHDRG